MFPIAFKCVKPQRTLGLDMTALSFPDQYFPKRPPQLSFRDQLKNWKSKYVTYEVMASISPVLSTKLSTSVSIRFNIVTNRLDIGTFDLIGRCWPAGVPTSSSDELGERRAAALSMIPTVLRKFTSAAGAPSGQFSLRNRVALFSSLGLVRSIA